MKTYLTQLHKFTACVETYRPMSKNHQVLYAIVKEFNCPLIEPNRKQPTALRHLWFYSVPTQKR